MRNYAKLSTSVEDFHLRRDLASCSLVCRAWKTRAQKHLFAFLTIKGKRLSRYESLVLKSPILRRFAKELFFYNEYIDESESTTTHRTVETASHAVRIVQKLPQVRRLLLDTINLASEHPNFPRYMSSLTHITQLDFVSPVPTKLFHLARMLVGLRGLSTLYLEVPIVISPNPTPLHASCYNTKSCLTSLDLPIHSGGQLLLDWLVQAGSFTKSLQRLQVSLEDHVPPSEVPSIVESVQSLLDNCSNHLKEWFFGAKVEIKDFSNIPDGNIISAETLNTI